jgi:hypothetical protein
MRMEEKNTQPENKGLLPNSPSLQTFGTVNTVNNVFPGTNNNTTPNNIPKKRGPKKKSGDEDSGRILREHRSYFKDDDDDREVSDFEETPEDPDFLDIESSIDGLSNLGNDDDDEDEFYEEDGF